MLQYFAHKLAAPAGDQHVRLLPAEHLHHLCGAFLRRVADADPLTHIAVGPCHSPVAHPLPSVQSMVKRASVWLSITAKRRRQKPDCTTLG